MLFTSIYTSVFCRGKNTKKRTLAVHSCNSHSCVICETSPSNRVFQKCVHSLFERSVRLPRLVVGKVKEVLGLVVAVDRKKNGRVGGGGRRTRIVVLVIVQFWTGLMDSILIRGKFRI